MKYLFNLAETLPVCAENIKILDKPDITDSEDYQIKYPKKNGHWGRFFQFGQRCS